MSTLTVTLVQAKLFWEDKAVNLLQLEQKIADIHKKTEVVILPEMFSTGFSMNPAKLAEGMDGPTLKWMQEMALRYKIILTGSIIASETVDNSPRYYNRLIWMLPNGKYGYYDKRHLFAFAGEDAQYTAGSKRLVASAKGWRLNLQVCYDLRFPVWARQQPEDDAAFEYDILVYVANWPESRSTAWKTLLQARAIENQCYVIGVNRVGEDGNGVCHSGDSMVVSPLGEILYTQKDAEDVHTITLQKAELEAVRSRFPFWKDADGFAIER
ncbi:MAG: amidohydrolase [Niabella sp.]